MSQIAFPGTAQADGPSVTFSFSSDCTLPPCFPSAYPGDTTEPQYITLTNSGNALLSISSVSLAGDGPEHFAIVSGGGGAVLAPGASHTVAVVFAPLRYGSINALLVIITNAPNSPHEFGLRSLGSRSVEFSMSAIPNPLEFGSQPVGITSAPRTITLTNTGYAPGVVTGLRLNGLDSGSFIILSGDGTGGSSVLRRGENRSFSIAFRPLTLGPKFVELQIHVLGPERASTEIQYVALTGNGLPAPAPAVTLSPTPLSFGNQLLGTVSPLKSVNLTNTGEAPLTITGVTITGSNAASFAVTEGSSGGLLQPGASRTISLSFTPVTLGSHSASLLIETNAANSPHNVLLIGNGVDGTPESALPGIMIGPSSLNFEAIPVGSTSGARSVSVSNNGTADLEITSVSLSGAHSDDFHVVSGGVGSLTVGSSRAISVVFSPTTEGSRTAVLTIRHNAAGSPNTVTLVGIGTNPSTPPIDPGPTWPAPVISGYAATAPRGVPIFSAPPTAPLLILGRNLGQSGRLTFNGVPTPLTLSWTPTEIVALVPASPSYPFRGPVTVVVDGQTGAGPEFTITLPAAPPAPTPDWPVFMHDYRQLGLTGSALDPRGLFPWSVSLGSRPGTSPVVLQGTAYVGTGVGDVVAVDVTGRSLRWQRSLGAPVGSAPAADPGGVVVSAGGLYRLRASDGAILWQRPDIVAGDDVSPMQVGNTVLIGAQAAAGPGAVVYAVNATTGANVWPAPVPLPVAFDNRATAAVYPELGLLFLGLGPVRGAAGPNAVMALRLWDGSTAWSQPTALPAGPAPTGLSLGWVAAGGAASSLQPAVFVAAGSRVSALNAATGSVIWSRTLADATLFGPPVLSSAAPNSAILYVGGASGQVYALDSSTGVDAPGSPMERLTAITGTLARVGDHLYVPTAGGLIALDVRTGTRVWSSPLSAASGVAVAGGSPFVATSDNRLVGFSTAPPPVTVVHDLSIESIQVASTVSRSRSAEVRVTLVNRGTATESYNLQVRVQPGRLLLHNSRGTLAAGQKRVVSFFWSPAQMGDDGPKTLAAQVELQGQTDITPVDNHAIQVVTVGP